MYEEDTVKKMLLPAVRVQEDLWRAVIKRSTEHEVAIGTIIRAALREHLERTQGNDDKD